MIRVVSSSRKCNLHKSQNNRIIHYTSKKLLRTPASPSGLHRALWLQVKNSDERFSTYEDMLTTRFKHGNNKFKLNNLGKQNTYYCILYEFKRLN